MGQVAPVKTAIFGKTYAELDALEQTLGETGHRLYSQQIAAIRKAVEKADAVGYMKHGEPQERVLGLKMPPPNLKPDFEEQARSFVDGILNRVVDATARADAGRKGAR